MPYTGYQVIEHPRPQNKHNHQLHTSATPSVRDDYNDLVCMIVDPKSRICMKSTFGRKTSIKQTTGSMDLDFSVGSRARFPKTAWKS